MKIGNFVSEKQIELTQQEKDIFYKYFISLIHKYNIPLMFNRVIKTETNSYYFEFQATKEIKGRNRLKDRIELFTGVSFVVQKNVGFLDVTDWKKDTKCVKDYDNAPPFQYSVNLIPCGYIKPYKKQKPRSMFVKDHYKYGTEFTDINLDNAIYDLYKILTIV